MTKLDAYLRRIGFQGTIAPTLECLTQIHRQQAFTVPYEALDIMFGRIIDRDVGRIFDRVVNRRRGGWCYELHELLAWALRKIGFSVRIVTAGIHRREYGDVKLGNHTAVLVDLDRVYLADLGLGDGIRDPIPLEEGDYHQGRLSFRLERIPDGYWRFQNHAFSYPTNFDFRDNEPLDETLIERHTAEFRTSPDSMYVLNLVCQIMQEETVTCLTGRILRQKTPVGTSKRLIGEEEFEDTIGSVFGIRDPEIRSLWPRVQARHEAVFGNAPIEQLNITGF
jgi:N-hydroxyarylamine O-acetyltransferase